MILALTVVVAACGWGERAEVRFTLVNNTDTTLCVFPGLPGPGVSICNEIKPGKQKDWRPECTPDNLELSDVTAVLTAGLAGEVIYDRTATCQQWIDSGATITIDQRDGEFVVTDNLPDDTPSPSP